MKSWVSVSSRKLGRSMSRRIAVLVMACWSLNAPAMPIYIAAAPGLGAIEPTWVLSAFTLTIEVESNDTIDTVKNTINTAVPSIPVSDQVLLFGALELDGQSTLADYNIQKETTLILDSIKSVRQVPVPPTIALVAIGLAGLWFQRRWNA